MTPGPQEIVRSEVEGGLSGPANSLTSESIDCGCGRYRLPRLAKFATRRVFLALLCCIGALQAAAQAYLYVTSSTIARRFQFDPYLMGMERKTKFTCKLFPRSHLILVCNFLQNGFFVRRKSFL